MNYLMMYLMLCLLSASASESPDKHYTHHRRRDTVYLDAQALAGLGLLTLQKTTRDNTSSMQAPPPSPTSEPGNALTIFTGSQAKERIDRQSATSPQVQKARFSKLLRNLSQTHIAQDPLTEGPAAHVSSEDNSLGLKQKSLSLSALNSPGDFIVLDNTSETGLVRIKKFQDETNH